MRRTTAAKSAGKRSGYEYAGEALHEHWAALHKGDREPWPKDGKLQDAWRDFHSGDFAQAVRKGAALGAPGAVVANKAAAIQTLYLEKDEQARMRILREAVERGERAVAELPDRANAHYTLALVLGRYSQRISIVEAVAAGYGGRVREHLERTLALEPKHAEAHVALGLFHAELVHTLGGLAARLTYGASADAAIEHFRKACKLVPGSAIAHVEYARGLLLLDAVKYRAEVEKLCDHGASCKPVDMMEQLDVERARHHCKAQ